MDANLASQTAQFLRRAQLVGEEVPAFMACMNALQAIIVAPPTPDAAPGDAVETAPATRKLGGRTTK